MKKYKYAFITEDGTVLKAKRDACLTCRKCTDVFFDWDGRPYMFSCENDFPFTLNCTAYVHDSENPAIFDYDEWEAMSKEEQQKAIKKIKRIPNMADILEGISK